MKRILVTFAVFLFANLAIAETVTVRLSTIGTSADDTAHSIHSAELACKFALIEANIELAKMCKLLDGKVKELMGTEHLPIITLKDIMENGAAKCDARVETTCTFNL
jgi:hypothetical protein